MLPRVDVAGASPARPTTGTFGAASMRARFGDAQWISRLTVADPTARAAAIRALARYSQPGPAQEEAIQNIAEGLRTESDAAVQTAMVDALATMARERAVGALVPLVCTRGSLAPAAARRALEFVGPLLDRDGIDAIVAGLAGAAFSANEALRLAAVDALAAAPDEPFSDRVSVHRATPARLALLLDAIGRRGDGRWGSAVLEQLQSTQRPVLFSAVRAVANLRLLEAASPLSRMIRDRALDTELQIAAIQALAVVGAGDPEATREALRAALGNTATADTARRAVATLGVRALVPEVARGLDAAWRVDRLLVAESLGDIGGAQAARLLLTAVEHERDEIARRVLWRAAVRADATSARLALESAAEADRAARWVAVEWLAREGNAPRMRGTAALAASGDVTAMTLECARARCGAAISRLADADPARRGDAAWAVSFAPTVDAATVIARFESERDPVVRLLLAFALMRSPAPSVTSAFERVALQDEQHVSAEQAVIAELAARRGSIAVRRLVPAMLADARGAVRALGLWTAARTSDPLGLTAATRLANEDESADVRAAARAVAAQRSGSASAFGGNAVLHAAGLGARSVWIAWLPGGQVVVSAATSDGTLIVPSMPSGEFLLEALP